VAEFEPHHLSITAEHVQGNRGWGRVFLIPGSDGRARRISERFEGAECIPSDRQHNVYLGSLPLDGGGSIEVASVCTGMGCPTLSIVMTELILLGARLFVRVGTAGSLKRDTIRTGSLVIATAGVRDEGASNRYIDTGYPAVADPDMVAALERAAIGLGFGDRTYKGVVHAKDALYAVEFGHGPLADENEAYLARLAQMGVLASDMETSHLFVLSDVHSGEVGPISAAPSPAGKIKSGAVLAVVGDDSPFAEPEAARAAEQAAVDVAVQAVRELDGILR
jgi:uridine phosphorylase